MCIRDSFENEEGASRGVCCVCYKKGVLGRCPNVECGLLMHYSCVGVAPTQSGPLCPICRDESSLRRLKPEKEAEEDGDRRVPYWHEAQLGAAKKRFIKPVLSPENAFAEFPDSRWPKEEEAKYHGYESVEDWYVASRRRGSPAVSTKETRAEIAQLKADFASRKAMHASEEEAAEGQKADAVLTMGCWRGVVIAGGIVAQLQPLLAHVHRSHHEVVNHRAQRHRRPRSQGGAALQTVEGWPRRSPPAGCIPSAVPRRAPRRACELTHRGGP